MFYKSMILVNYFFTMKTTIKSTFFALLFITIYASAGAQVVKPHTWNLSFGADAAFPENSFRKTHAQGLGITVKSEYVFDKHYSITFSTGFYTLAGRTNLLNPGGKAANGLPLKVGGRYYLGNFYLGGEAGYLNLSGFQSKSGFLYSFFLGDELITSKNGNSLDISARHEAWVTDVTRAFVGLRLAYEFRLR